MNEPNCIVRNKTGQGVHPEYRNPVETGVEHREIGGHSYAYESQPPMPETSAAAAGVTAELERVKAQRDSYGEELASIIALMGSRKEDLRWLLSKATEEERPVIKAEIIECDYWQLMVQESARKIAAVEKEAQQ